MFVLHLITISVLIHAIWSEESQRDDLRFVKDEFDIDVSTSFNHSSPPVSLNIRVDKPEVGFQLKTNFSKPSRRPTRRPLFKLPIFLFGQKFSTNRSVIQDIMKFKLHTAKNSSENPGTHLHKVTQEIADEQTTAKKQKSLHGPWSQAENPSQPMPNETQHQIEKDCRVKEFYNFSNSAHTAHWRLAKAAQVPHPSDIDVLKHFMKLLKALADHPLLDLKKICQQS